MLLPSEFEFLWLSRFVDDLYQAYVRSLKNQQVDSKSIYIWHALPFDWNHWSTDKQFTSSKTKSISWGISQIDLRWSGESLHYKIFHVSRISKISIFFCIFGLWVYGKVYTHDIYELLKRDTTKLAWSTKRPLPKNWENIVEGN